MPFALPIARTTVPLQSGEIVKRFCEMPAKEFVEPLRGVDSL